MSNRWAKFKMWCRVVAFGAAAVYVLVFISLNHAETVTLHFGFREYKGVSVLLLLLLTSVSSIFGWWLLKTVFVTVRQVRQARRRQELERIGKEHEDMIQKAAKLQTKPEVVVARPVESAPENPQ